jgi:hypothetical protein
MPAEPTETLLTAPQSVIGRQWSMDSSPEQRRILGLARDALLFAMVTGQQKRFEDFRKSLESGPFPRPNRDDPAKLGERLNQTHEFFSRLLAEPGFPEDTSPIQVILDVLRFIDATDQYSAFSEYLEHEESGAPPYALAAFDTKEDVGAWLKKHPNPPQSGLVLIANQHHYMIYDRSADRLLLPRDHLTGYHFARLKKEHPPHAVASFGSLQEAEAWWQSQPPSVRWAWVSVAGEFYVAAYYSNIHHRALFPLSLGDGYEEPDEAPPATP